MAQNDSHYNQVTTRPGSENTSSGEPAYPVLPMPLSFGDNQPVPIPDWNWGNNWDITRSYGQVRFLNASTNTFDVDIAIDGNPYVLNSRFGMISGYDWIADGFHTVTVRRSTSIRTILFQQNLPFSASQKVTMVLVDSVVGGLEMVRVVDTGCRNLPQTTGCYRFANMSFPNSAYDVLLGNSETVFRNVTYTNVTAYKQTVANTYQFSVANATLQVAMRELPIIVIGVIGTGSGTRDIVLDYQAAIAPGRNFTTYVIGNNWSDFSLRAITVED